MSENNSEQVPATIRPATLADARGIAEVLQDTGWFSAIDGKSPAAAAAHVARHLGLCLADGSHAVWVAEDTSGQVLGYIAVHWLPYFFLAGPEGYISELFVHTSARGQGIGTRLLEAVKEQGIARGCCRLQLLNKRTRPSYERAFYPKAGWQERPEMVSFALVL